MELDRMPSKEELEWYLSGAVGGKDGKGVAVFYDTETGSFQPVPQFRERVDEWRSKLPPDYDDSFRLDEMPSRALIDVLVNNQPGIVFNRLAHRVEFQL